MSDEQSWTGKKYNEYYNAYVPWLEDKYLAWFGENKTSYTTKGVLFSSQLSDPSLPFSFLVPLLPSHGFISP